MRQSAAKPNFLPLKEDSDYLIYNNGQLFSKKSNKFLKGKIDNAGYHMFALKGPAFRQPNGNARCLYAHRLVAEYFLPNENNYKYVDHIDGNKLNNTYTNLRWVTQKENMTAYREKNSIKRNKRIKKEDLPNEIWKIIPHHPNYSVSNLGRVYNNKTNYLMKLDQTSAYNRVSFSDKSHASVHVLVYSVFHDDYDLQGYNIHHINSDKRDNRLENLEKVTPSQNNLYRKLGKFND